MLCELDKIKENEMKKKTIKEYKRRLRLAVAVFRYGAGILQWKESELKNVDRKSRKTMTMYGALHPKSDTNVTSREQLIYLDVT